MRGFTGADKTRKNAASKATKTPTMIDIAWAAGIFEGEGCVHAPRYSIQVTIGQKDKWLLNKLQELFGGTISKNTNTGVNHGTLYLWRIFGARGRGFIYTIYSFLSPRRKAQVKKALTANKAISVDVNHQAEVI